MARLLHAAQGVAVVLAQQKCSVFPVTTRPLNTRPAYFCEDASGTWFLRHVIFLMSTWHILLRHFFFMSAIAHRLYCDMVSQERYEANLEQGDEQGSLD
jgi:hypothetical protein